MRLRELAEQCEKLEATRSRRTMVNVVADLLRAASDAEREPILYLLQADLRPPYEGVELGVGDKLLAQAIAAAYKAPLATVDRQYGRVGDLGLVARALARSGQARGPSVVGYFRGRGKRAALGIGSLLAAVRDPAHDRFRTVAKIGSGLSESAWRDLRGRLDKRATRVKPPDTDSLIRANVWVEPTNVVEVLADEITRSPFHTCGKVGDAPGYALRFPRVIGMRADKGPAECNDGAGNH